LAPANRRGIFDAVCESAIGGHLRLLQESYFVGQQPISTFDPIWSLETQDVANACRGVAALFLSHQEKASDAFRVEDPTGNKLHLAHCSTQRRQRSGNALLVDRNEKIVAASLKDRGHIATEEIHSLGGWFSDVRRCCNSRGEIVGEIVGLV
jgi:hypothetical protein